MKKFCAIALLVMLLTLLLAGCSNTPELKKPQTTTLDQKKASLREQIESLRGAAGRIEIATERVTTGTIASELSITGELVPRKSVIVKPLMEGTITFLRPIKVGDIVEENEIVAKIDDRDIEDEIDRQKRQITISEETLKLDENTLSQKQKDLEFDKKLFKEGFINENELRRSELDLKRSEIALRQSGLGREQEETKLKTLLRKREKVPVKAPISGMVVLASHLANRTGTTDLLNDEIMALEGTNVSPGTEIFGIVSREGYLAQCLVNGKDKANIQIGQKARVTVISHKAVTVEGEVIKIAQLQEAKSHAYKVWIQLDKMDKSFTSGLFVRANIELERSENAIIVPKEYVKEKDNSIFVQVVENDLVKNRTVETGISQGGKIEIKSGLKISDILVASDKIISPDLAVKPVELKKEKKEESQNPLML